MSSGGICAKHRYIHGKCSGIDQAYSWMSKRNSTYKMKGSMFTEKVGWSQMPPPPMALIYMQCSFGRLHAFHTLLFLASLYIQYLNVSHTLLIVTLTLPTLWYILIIVNQLSCMEHWLSRQQSDLKPWNHENIWVFCTFSTYPTVKKKGTSSYWPSSGGWGQWPLHFKNQCQI